jgi:superfamily I DNA and RNA helicase
MYLRKLEFRSCGTMFESLEDSDDNPDLQDFISCSDKILFQAFKSLCKQFLTLTMDFFVSQLNWNLKILNSKEESIKAKDGRI